MLFIQFLDKNVDRYLPI